MQDPFAKYTDYHHASMFAGEFRRDHSGTSDADMILAAWKDMLTDMKALIEGGDFLPSHNRAAEQPEKGRAA
jgi:hypothetical protein